MFLIDAPNNTDNLVQEIASESAVHVSQLPPVWQDIARGRANIGLADPQSFVEMAQLFQYKLEHGDVDLFKERKELALLKPAFSQLFGHLAKETLEFYGLCSLSVDHLRRNLKKKIPALYFFGLFKPQSVVGQRPTRRCQGWDFFSWKVP